MRRLFAFIWLFIKLAVLLAIAAWLYVYPGTLSIEWQGTVIETSTAFAGIVLLIFVILSANLYHGWRTLLGWPREWKRNRRLKSLELGYKSLNTGLLSIAAGDSVNASRHAKKALNALPDLALSHLLAAQAAQLRQDEIAADAHLAILAQHPEGQLFGIRGQLSRALQRNDSTEALRLSRLAYQQQPQHPWIVDTIVQMEARSGNWVQVEKILRQAIRLGSPETAKWQKDLAAALLAISDEALSRQDIDAALECAREAHKRAHDWAPAATRLAELWSRKTYRRRAQKVLISAWEKSPHPDLVTSWIYVSGAERSHDHTAIVEKLIAHRPDCAEAAIAMARAYYGAGLWGVARQHTQRAIDYCADRAAYRLMADIEQADSGNAARVRAWLDKAADAKAEPQWQCLVTGDLFAHWQALNRQQDFNTIQWQIPIATHKTDARMISGF